MISVCIYLEALAGNVKVRDYACIVAKFNAVKKNLVLVFFFLVCGFFGWGTGDDCGNSER